MSVIPPKSADKRVGRAKASDFLPSIRQTVLGTCGFFPDGDVVRERWERIVSR